jgi:hypothetical protein
MRTDRREIAEPGSDGRAWPAVDASMSKSDIYNEARRAGIKGRSAMDKEQLVEALRKRRATSVAHEPAPSKADSAEVVRTPAGARGPDRCAIVYRSSGRYGEFQVVVTGTDGSRRSVARSPAFRAPRFGRVRGRGPARAAHELLVSRLEACEWWPVDSGKLWHEVRFVRLPDEGMRRRRALVTVVREAGQARFAAEELDSYGKPTPLRLSTPFGAPRFRRVRPSMQAKAAVKQLVRRMESEGWKAAKCVGNDWYAVSLWRPVDTSQRPL